MIIFYIIYPMLILIQKLAKRLQNRIQCCYKVKKYLKHRLYYNALIVVVFESYALVALCCIIGLTALRFNSIGLAFQSLVCIAFTIWIFVAPYLIIKAGVTNIETLRLTKTK